MIDESIHSVFFLCQLIYLLSISRFFTKYFSHVDHGGLILQGFLTSFLTKKTVLFIFLTWIAALVSTLFLSGGTSVIAGVICLIYSRYFFIFLRYKSIGRGNGAPGFMSYWTVAYAVVLLFLQFRGIETDVVLLLMKWDFALIMLSAGFYKHKTGYLRGRGIEYGLKNEMWTWAHRWFQRINNDSLLFKLLNFFSIFVEYLIFIFLIIPSFEELAAFLLATMFLLLFAFVRLGSLPITMFGLSYAFFSMDLEIEWHQTPILLQIFCVVYGISLVLSLAWSWLYFLKIQLPRLFTIIFRGAYQLTGVIIWSVFTARLTENLIKTYSVQGQQLIPVKSSDFGVHSGISLTTIATYTDYFPESGDEQDRRFKIYLSTIYRDNFDKELHFFKIDLGDKDFRVIPCKIFKVGSQES